MKINGIQVHQSITADRVVALVEARMTGLDNPGLCIMCGHEQDGCEPDARNYTCEACGAEQVFGADELLLDLA
jgi:hypothetical protein